MPTNWLVFINCAAQCSLCVTHQVASVFINWVQFGRAGAQWRKWALCFSSVLLAVSYSECVLKWSPCVTHITLLHSDQRKDNDTFFIVNKLLYDYDLDFSPKAIGSVGQHVRRCCQFCRENPHGLLLLWPLLAFARFLHLV